MKKPITIDEFTRAYLVAALWTFDDHAPPGDYERSGRVEKLFPLITKGSIKQAVAECAAFQAENAKDLAASGRSADQHGRDFWLSRNGHGSGFFDRDGSEEINDRLQNSAENCGERYCFKLGRSGWIHIE